MKDNEREMWKDKGADGTRKGKMMIVGDLFDI